MRHYFECFLCVNIDNGHNQLSSVSQLCLTLCDPMDCSSSGFPVHHQLLEPTQTHVHHIGDAIQPSHPLSSPSPPTFNLSQHQGLFQWVSSSHQVTKVLELQLQHQSLQWLFRMDFLYDWLVWSPCSRRNSQESSPTSQNFQSTLWEMPGWMNHELESRLLKEISTTSDMQIKPL